LEEIVQMFVQFFPNLFCDEWIGCNSQRESLTDPDVFHANEDLIARFLVLSARYRLISLTMLSYCHSSPGLKTRQVTMLAAC